jgi:hypothetical protein
VFSQDEKKKRVFSHSRKHSAQDIVNENHLDLYLDGIHALRLTQTKLLVCNIKTIIRVVDWKIRSTTLFLVPHSRGVEEERGGIASLCIGVLRSVRGKGGE